MKRIERAWREVRGAAGVTALVAIESMLVLTIVALTGVGR